MKWYLKFSSVYLFISLLLINYHIPVCFRLLIKKFLSNYTVYIYNRMKKFFSIFIIIFLSNFSVFKAFENIL